MFQAFTLQMLHEGRRGSNAFFFSSEFSFTTIHEWEGISLTPHYLFHPLHRHIDISRAKQIFQNFFPLTLIFYEDWYCGFIFLHNWKLVLKNADVSTKAARYRFEFFPSVSQFQIFSPMIVIIMNALLISFSKFSKKNNISLYLQCLWYSRKKKLIDRLN